MKKTIKIILTAMTWIFFALTIVILIMGIGAAKKGRPINLFGYGYAVVVTDSMEDTIMTGEVVFFKYIDFDDVEKLDIIIFHDTDLNINKVHRVVEVDEIKGELTTRGDNPNINNNDSLKVTEELFYGKVTKHTKLFGIGNIIKNGKNIIFFVIIMIFLYIIVTEIINILKLNTERQKLILEEKKKNDLDLEKEKIREELLKELEESKKNSDNN